MVFSKPSPHRCKILTVSQLLSKEDVDEILDLSEDFIPQSEVKQISSGLDLTDSVAKRLKALDCQLKDHRFKSHQLRLEKTFFLHLAPNPGPSKIVNWGPGVG